MDPGAGPAIHRLEAAARIAAGMIGGVLVFFAIQGGLVLPALIPQGGVAAANRAVQSVLEELVAFCAEAAHGVTTRK